MKKGLGRGFESLIPTNLIDETFDPTAKQDDKVSRLKDIAITKISPDPEQPRRFFDEAALSELAESIKEHGVVQPIVVTPKGSNYLIVAGERRWRAAKKAGLEELPCIVRSMSGQNRLEISLIENLQRHDLNVLETATAYLKLRDQFNMTLEEIGKRLGGKSVSAVSNTLRLLRLPKSVRQAIFDGELSEGQARPLIGLPESMAESIMKKTIADGWSVRHVEQAVALWKQTQDNPVEEKKPADSPHAEAIESLSKHFGTGVKIRTNNKGAGQISIAFKNEAEFDRIRQLLENA